MNNIIRGINSKDITIQLNRAEVQKDLLIKNIYKEYDIYFQIVRKSLFNAAEKGIFSLFSDLSITDKALNSRELTNFINKNISLLIHSKLPFITIEQLKLGDISDPQKELVNLNALKELVEFKENKTENFEYENDLIKNESLEFHSNNNLNTYEYYETFSEEKFLSVNLDEKDYFNSFSSQNRIKNIQYKKYADAILELIEKTTDNKVNSHMEKNNQRSDVLNLKNNFNFFELIDKSFNNLLLNLSYEINLELLKINLIKKFVSKNAFKCLSNKNYIIKHPHPFIIRYHLCQNNLIIDNNKYSDMYLFNISNIELEFYNLDLSICRNNINQLKNKLKLLNKKERYWKHKEFSLKTQN